MVQLVFDADDARGSRPGARLDRLQLPRGRGASELGRRQARARRRHAPVVYPSVGSHANKFTEALYLGSSAEAGVGCDDTRGPHRELRPAVATIPSDPRKPPRRFPVDRLRGTVGRAPEGVLQRADGPEPEEAVDGADSWSEGWRERSYAVPTGGLLGTSATDLFCSGVESGSRGLVLLLQTRASSR